MNIQLPKVGLKGIMRMVVSKDAEMKEVTHDTGEFPNLITNVGMDRVGTVSSGPDSISTFRSLCGRFVVGSGQTPPTFADTALQAPVAFASGDVGLVGQSSNYARGWYEITVSYQFGQGVAAGNLSEIGIQSGSASGPLWSRALILDGNGNPTTITVLPSDFLTCYYTLRIMIPQEDQILNFNADYGDDGIVPVTATVRPINANSSNNSEGWGLATRLGGLNDNWRRITFNYGGGLLPPTNSYPSDPGSLQATSLEPYISGTYETRANFHAGLNQINSNNITRVAFRCFMGAWQMHFDPPLQKDNTQEMQFTFGYSWARA